MFNVGVRCGVIGLARVFLNGACRANRRCHPLPRSSYLLRRGSGSQKRHSPAFAPFQGFFRAYRGPAPKSNPRRMRNNDRVARWIAAQFDSRVREGVEDVRLAGTRVPDYRPSEHPLHLLAHVRRILRRSRGTMEVIIPHPSGLLFVQDRSTVSLPDPSTGQMLAKSRAFAQPDPLRSRYDDRGRGWQRLSAATGHNVEGTLDRDRELPTYTT